MKAEVTLVDDIGDGKTLVHVLVTQEKAIDLLLSGWPWPGRRGPGRQPERKCYCGPADYCNGRPQHVRVTTPPTEGPLVLTRQQLVDVMRMVVAETLYAVEYNDGPKEVLAALDRVKATIPWPEGLEPLTFEQVEDAWRAYHGNEP